MTPGLDIKHWIAKRKAELIKQISRRRTTIPEDTRCYDLPQPEIENGWIMQRRLGMGKVLKANPKDIAMQYESQLRELQHGL